jgi:hypothetical protein
MSASASTAANPLSDKQVTTAQNEYYGILQIEKGVLKFTGASVLINSITQISNYPVRPINRISILQMIISAILGLLFLSASGIDTGFGRSGFGFLKVPGLLLLAVPVYGIYERTRPEKYGITLELSSGFRHYFISKSQAFINSVYEEFVDAVQNKRDFMKVFNNTVIQTGEHSTVNLAQNESKIDNSSGKTEINNTSGEVNLNSNNNTDNSTGKTEVNNTVSGNGNMVGDMAGTQQTGNTSVSGGSTTGDIGYKES